MIKKAIDLALPVVILSLKVGKPILFACINNGIFLCGKCGSSKFDSDPNIFGIKSIRENWHIDEFGTLINGGN